MKFYYSGAEAFQAWQPNIDRSLGGFKSSTPLPNDSLGNLFSTLSYNVVRNGSDEVRGVFLKNELGVVASNLTVYFDKPVGCLSRYKIAVVTSPDGESMEKISNFRSKPFYGDFVEPTSVGTRVTITPSFAVGAILGVWIERIVDKQDSPSCDALLTAPAVAETETVELVLEWS